MGGRTRKGTSGKRERRRGRVQTHSTRRLGLWEMLEVEDWLFEQSVRLRLRCRWEFLRQTNRAL